MKKRIGILQVFLLASAREEAHYCHAQQKTILHYSDRLHDADRLMIPHRIKVGALSAPF